MSVAHLAVDLGASSGRAMLGVLSGEPQRLELIEVHRFEHHACPTPTGPVWDLTGIWREVLTGLKAAAEMCRQRGWDLASVGVDTWGVDCVLVGRGGEVLALPHCYRDPRNEPACRETLQLVGGYERLYALTGIQLMPFNTLFQLQAMQTAEPRLFDAAERLLFLPDLLHYWLSGAMKVERSIASTSSMLDVQTGQWNRGLVEEIGVPSRILGDIVEPGTILGELRDELVRQTGAPRGLKVIAPASHDTASAVAAAPAAASAAANGWAYLSSGTWSLLGAELQQPLATAETRQAPFTNERGVAGTIRFLKNIAGLWLVQELRREYAEAGRSFTFAQLDAEAGASEPFRTIVDPNDSRLAAPGPMTPRLNELAKESGQKACETPGQFVRCCLESLALCYRRTADELARLTCRPLAALHIVGGGSQNRLLNQMTADALDCPVTAGPIEATAIGNALVQAMGCGAMAGPAEIRAVVARSFPVETVNQSTAAAEWAKRIAAND